MLWSLRSVDRHGAAREPLFATLCCPVQQSECTHAVRATTFAQTSSCHSVVYCCIAAACLFACPNQKLRGRSETSCQNGDWTNIQPSGQGVSLFRARSRLVLHETSKSIYSGYLGWSGWQLRPSLLALTWLVLQPIPPPLQSETHPILILAFVRTWFETPRGV